MLTVQKIQIKEKVANKTFEKNPGSSRDMSYTIGMNYY